MSAHAIIKDLVACGAAPRLTQDGASIVVCGRLSAELRQRVMSHKSELVRLLASAANSPKINLKNTESDPWRVTPAPPAHDPGEAALQALAMAYCTHTSASDKARQDWRQDVANTPPELRGDLYQHLREQLHGQRPPAPAAQASNRPSTGWLHMSQIWRELDRQYLQHHWQCATCKTASTGHSERCAIGQHLHTAYAQAVARA